MASQWHVTDPLTSQELWPLGTRVVHRVRLVELTRDAVVARAVVRASRMDRERVVRALLDDRALQGRIMRFEGVRDVLVLLALTLEHVEQTVDAAELRGVEGWCHTRNLRFLERLLLLESS